MKVEKDGVVSFKDGKAEVVISAGVDQDQDGVKSVELETKVKLDVPELLKELGKSKDKPSLLAAAAFAKEFLAKLPDLEKDILD